MSHLFNLGARKLPLALRLAPPQIVRDASVDDFVPLLEVVLVRVTVSHIRLPSKEPSTDIISVVHGRNHGMKAAIVTALPPSTCCRLDAGTYRETSQRKVHSTVAFGQPLRHEQVNVS